LPWDDASFLSPVFLLASVTARSPPHSLQRFSTHRETGMETFPCALLESYVQENKLSTEYCSMPGAGGEDAWRTQHRVPEMLYFAGLGKVSRANE
jgi:hypothetical protein